MRRDRWKHAQHLADEHIIKPNLEHLTRGHNLQKTVSKKRTGHKREHASGDGKGKRAGEKQKHRVNLCRYPFMVGWGAAMGHDCCTYTVEAPASNES